MVKGTVHSMPNGQGKYRQTITVTGKGKKGFTNATSFEWIERKKDKKRYQKKVTQSIILITQVEYCSSLHALYDINLISRKSKKKRTGNGKGKKKGVLSYRIKNLCCNYSSMLFTSSGARYETKAKILCGLKDIKRKTFAAINTVNHQYIQSEMKFHGMTVICVQLRISKSKAIAFLNG